jgi:hypothetical protein
MNRKKTMVWPQLDSFRVSIFFMGYFSEIYAKIICLSIIALLLVPIWFGFATS